MFICFKGTDAESLVSISGSSDYKRSKFRIIEGNIEFILTQNGTIKTIFGFDWLGMAFDGITKIYYIVTENISRFKL